MLSNVFSLQNINYMLFTWVKGGGGGGAPPSQPQVSSTVTYDIIVC